MRVSPGARGRRGSPPWLVASAAVAAARFLVLALRRPDPGLTLNLLRGLLSHEATAKLARLGAIVSEWGRGRYLPGDAADALALLDDLDAIYARGVRLAAQSTAGWVHMFRIQLSLEHLRSLIRVAGPRDIVPLRRLVRIRAELARLRSSGEQLTEHISLRHATTLAMLASLAADEVRREFAGGTRARAVPVILEPRETRTMWIAAGHAATWRDILRNLIRNAVEATGARATAGRPEPAGGPVSAALLPVVIRLGTAEGAAGGATLEVEDHGVGLSEEEQEGIWRDGYSRKGPQHGQGLTGEKRRFIERYATLGMTSARGYGTTFRLVFRPDEIPIPAPPLWRMGSIVVPAALLVIAITAVALSLRSQPDPAVIRGDDTRTAIAYDADGHQLWLRNLDGRIVHNSVTPDYIRVERVYPLENTLIVRDRKGRCLRVVVSTVPEEGPGTLWFLDRRGNPRVILPLEWAPPRERRLGRLNAVWEAQVWDASGRRDLVVTHIRDNRYSASCTRLLTLSGATVGSYYHDGHLQFGGSGDFDGDGRTEVLLFGVSNHARGDTAIFPQDPGVYIDMLVMLEIDRFSGQAYPWNAWPGLPAAREEGYLLIPPISRSLRPRICDVDVSSSPRDEDPCIEVVVEDGRIYRLDHHLRPISCGVGDNTTAGKMAPTRPIAPLVYFHELARNLIDLEVR